MPTTDNERFDALRERLSRQMLISGFGEEGQKKIIAARFLVIGAGGLGSRAPLSRFGRRLPHHHRRPRRGVGKQSLAPDPP